MADLRNEDFNSISSECENSQNNQFSDLVIVELYHTGDDNELYIILQEEGTTEELICFYMIMVLTFNFMVPLHIS